MEEEGVFRFKRFSLSNSRSAMKVGTDGVLLGAAVTLDQSVRRVLDVGTGTGVIALMTAQRLSGINADFSILGIDIDAPSASEASVNFAASQWHGRMGAQLMDLDSCEGEYDLIVSNPPYFDLSLRNPDKRRDKARHAGASGRELSYRSLASYSAEHLSPEGMLALILPAATERDLVLAAGSHGLYPSRIMHIRMAESKAPARIIAEFTFKRQNTIFQKLTLRDAEGYTPAYRDLVRDFYLWA